jgi:NTP pyrophosphatase (non-canonical NTP hydrolase)
MSYADVEMKIVQWGEARKIVQNSTGLAQWQKTLEEVIELRDALVTKDRAAMIDAYGDILVTLIMGCACEDLNLVSCLEHAYDQIKDRKGHLTPDGIFVKEVLGQQSQLHLLA